MVVGIHGSSSQSARAAVQSISLAALEEVGVVERRLSRVTERSVAAWVGRNRGKETVLNNQLTVVITGSS